MDDRGIGILLEKLIFFADKEYRKKTRALLHFHFQIQFYHILFLKPMFSCYNFQQTDIIYLLLQIQTKQT